MTEREALTAAILERVAVHLERIDRAQRRHPWHLAVAFAVGLALGVWLGVAATLP